MEEVSLFKIVLFFKGYLGVLKVLYQEVLLINICFEYLNLSLG